MASGRLALLGCPAKRNPWPGWEKFIDWIINASRKSFSIHHINKDDPSRVTVTTVGPVTAYAACMDVPRTAGINSRPGEISGGDGGGKKVRKNEKRGEKNVSLARFRAHVQGGTASGAGHRGSGARGPRENLGLRLSCLVARQDFRRAAPIKRPVARDHFGGRVNAGHYHSTPGIPSYRE